MRTRKVRERESRSTGGPIFACGRGRRGRGRHGLCEWCDLSCKKVVLSALSPKIVCGAKTSGSFWARKCFLNPSFRTAVAQSEKRPLKGTPRFNTTRLYLFAAVFYLVAFNYCREEALKHDFGQKNPIGGPFLNLEIADWVGALQAARQPNGVAVKQLG